MKPRHPPAPVKYQQRRSRLRHLQRSAGETSVCESPAVNNSTNQRSHEASDSQSSQSSQSGNRAHKTTWFLVWVESFKVGPDPVLLRRSGEARRVLCPVRSRARQRGVQGFWGPGDRTTGVERPSTLRAGMWIWLLPLEGNWGVTERAEVNVTTEPISSQDRTPSQHTANRKQFYTFTCLQEIDTLTQNILKEIKILLGESALKTGWAWFSEASCSWSVTSDSLTAKHTHQIAVVSISSTCCCVVLSHCVMWRLTGS